MNSLQDKVILITGALGQIGRSACGVFLKKGAIVVANDYLAIEQCPKMMRLQEEYGEKRFLFIKADVSDENQVKNIISEIDQHYGRLDGSFHNAFTDVWKPVLEMSFTEWESVIRGTLSSTFLVCKYALPLMIKSGGGAILNTSSILSERPLKGAPAYSAAKAGINQFTRVLAADYASQGIRANVLLPGSIKSEEKLQTISEQEIQFFREITLLGRSGTPDEVSEMAAFLLSDASSYVTASLFTIDGGYGLGK